VRVLIMARTFLHRDYAAMLNSLWPWHELKLSVQRVVVLGEPRDDAMIGWHGFLASGEKVPDGEIAAMRAAVRPDDTAFLLYTSGSTAQPKGVRLAHSGLLKNCHAIGERQRLTEDDVLLLPISLFWSFGCSNGMMAALTHGAHDRDVNHSAKQSPDNITAGAFNEFQLDVWVVRSVVPHQFRQEDERDRGLHRHAQCSRDALRHRCERPLDAVHILFES
jgi:acyl-CoA synthetase (AMP-forming)/AMP-acid ligase II